VYYLGPVHPIHPMHPMRFSFRPVKCILVTRVCVCVSVCRCMPTLLHGSGGNLGMVARAPSCGLLGGFAIGAWVSLLWQDSTNAKCQRVFVLALCLVKYFVHALCLSWCDIARYRVGTSIRRMTGSSVVVAMLSGRYFSFAYHLDSTLASAFLLMWYSDDAEMVLWWIMNDKET